MKIAILGNYPPKSCGIATFTNSVARALLDNLRADEISDFAEIIAIEDEGQHHDYPAEVAHILPRDDEGAYANMANHLNEGSFDLLIVQHEYGIFGGPDGDYLLTLVNRLRIPLIVTCHTVLRSPSDGQLKVLQRLCTRANVMTVMSEMALRFLRDIYGCPSEKIQVIEHGVPVIETAPREELREEFGWSGRRVLFTFGLLSRGKGIETVIRALPAVVAEHPDTLYVVLGNTHPNVVRESGEEYREWLHELAEELGVGDNLQMIAKFAKEQYLFECLRAADIYVIPYPNEAQICSGTLAYAIGAGAAVVSTPFWHATELLAEGRGRLFPFDDAENLAGQLLELLNDEEKIQAIRARAGSYGKQLMWPKIGAEYIRSFGDARTAFNQSNISPASAPRPELRLDHLLRMTDDCGLIQHAKYATPNRHEGYCLDDNGRALLFTCMTLEADLPTKKQRRELLRLTEIYLAYIFHGQNEDGTFRNFMGYHRDFLEARGSQDSYGRALWGLALCAAKPPRKDLGLTATECFIRAIGHLDACTSPRTIAYGTIALSVYLGRYDDNNLRDLLDRSVNRLLRHYRDNQQDNWDWFEPYLSYDNGLMPLALYYSLRIFPREEVRQIAEAATEFLVSRTIVGGIPRPVGCHELCQLGGTPQQFDQQPLEAMADLLLHLEAYRQSGRPLDAERAQQVYSWFHGNNDLSEALYCPETAGCYDGLTAYGTNKNQGAESLLAYLVSRVAIEALPQVESNGPKGKNDTLRSLLNGFAPMWVESADAAISMQAAGGTNVLVSETALRHYNLSFLADDHRSPNCDYPMLGQ